MQQRTLTIGSVTSEDMAAQVERDLLADRAKIRGGLVAWQQQSERRRRRWIERFVRAEDRRAEFEVLLSARPGALEQWATFPPTQQREILAGIDYLRFWPRRWALPKARTAIERGSDYLRLAQNG
jgi:hypothetical protein